MTALPDKRWGWSLLAALGLLSCSFDDDRSLGSLGATAPDSVARGGGSTSGGQAGWGGASPVGGASTATTVGLGPGCASEPSWCSDNEYCETGVACRYTTTLPSCVARPTSCPEPSGRERACGCDGVLYESECLAQRAGASIGAFVNCAAVACQDVLDCLPLEDTCAALYGPSAPAPICNESRCDCQRPAVIQ